MSQHGNDTISAAVTKQISKSATLFTITLSEQIFRFAISRRAQVWLVPLQHVNVFALYRAREQH